MCINVPKVLSIHSDLEFMMVLQLPYDGYTSDSEITLNCYGKPHHNRNFSCPSGGMGFLWIYHTISVENLWKIMTKPMKNGWSAVIPDPPRPLLSRVTATRRWKRAHISIAPMIPWIDGYIIIIYHNIYISVLYIYYIWLYMNIYIYIHTYIQLYVPALTVLALWIWAIAPDHS